MLNRKIIPNIKPFNDIYNENCFYNSLFPVLKHFSMDIMYFLINSVIVYAWNQSERNTLTINYTYIKTLEELFNEIGIKVEMEKKEENIIEKLIHAINDDRPVIIWVDCFYESIRADTYKKKHWPHTWLIYGYDEFLKTANIIEHKQAETLTYEERSVSYIDVVQSYIGYLTNFDTNVSFPSYFEFYVNKCMDEANGSKNIHKNFIDVFHDNLKSNISVINKGIEELGSFFYWFNNIVEDKNVLFENVENLVNSFNKIILDKQLEMYRISNLGLLIQSEQLQHILSRIISLWIYIRKYLAKFLYSSIYKTEIIEKIKENATEIICLEKQYYECLLKELEKNR